MSKYDFARRLKRVVHEECEIVKIETKITHKSSNYFEQMSSLKSMLAKQNQEMCKFRKEVNKLKWEIEKLENYKQKVDERLCEIIQNVEKLQIEYQRILQEKIEQRRTALLQMDCIRSIKQATQTYINLDALPQLIQGVIISDQELSSEWKPFRIDPSKYTIREVQDMIWCDSKVDLIHRETWEKLLFGNILHDTSTNMETESDNVNNS